ncbi:pilus assembly protein TadG-related protein [Paraburkholderia madseniana]|uniref:pilus assembly protein TadG-related protein n=1 Tax=Paraburkholderia madseniana TaxID=2599607 RepID=UPI0015C57978|nr:pilus assembly protein TadG-related protein [Paraburkholderia madseniana]NPT65007.1 pilus assembly protein TadG [Paraburkholderia madseniana]
MRSVNQSGRCGAARRGERGAVSIFVALSLVALIGFVGLALDLGKLYVTRSELQNSADACALAAARDLTGATVNLSVSEAAGITAGHLNYALFQSGAVQMTTDSSVLFSDSLSNPFLPKSSVATPVNIKYAKCTTSKANIANWFIQVLGAFSGTSVANATVSATAVATVGAAQTTCAIPAFICKAGTETTPPTAGETYTVGQWIASKTGASPAYGPGNFGWAALDGSNSANSIKNELTGNFCSLPATGANIGSTGNMVADSGAWNTRFGIYGTSFKGPADGQPDFTGYAYTATTWTAQSNAYSDFVNERKTFQPYQGDKVTGSNTKGTYSASNYPLGADRRLALAPELDCGVLASSHQAPVISWDCVLMLDPMDSGGTAGPVHLEYRGSSSAPGSPCATQGVPGSGSSVGPQVPVLLQ